MSYDVEEEPEHDDRVSQMLPSRDGGSPLPSLPPRNDRIAPLKPQRLRRVAPIYRDLQKPHGADDQKRSSLPHRRVARGKTSKLPPNPNPPVRSSTVTVAPLLLPAQFTALLMAASRVVRSPLVGPM